MIVGACVRKQMGLLCALCVLCASQWVELLPLALSSSLLFVTGSFPPFQLPSLQRWPSLTTHGVADL